MAELSSDSESDLDVGSLQQELVRMFSSDISSHLEVSSGPGSKPAVIVDLERVLKIQEGQYGPDHAEVATTLFDLGKAYGDLFVASKSRDTDCLEQSRDYFERALPIKDAHYGADHTEVYDTLLHLGVAYKDLGDDSKTRDYFERVLRIEEAVCGPDDEELATTLDTLGAACGNLGDASKSRDYLERALKIKEANYGPDHAEVLMTLLNLKTVYRKLGDASKSRDCLERAMEIASKIPDVLERALMMQEIGRRDSLERIREAARRAAV